MRKLNGALLLLVVATATAAAEWVEKAPTSELSPIPGVEHRRLVFENSGMSERAIVDLAVFPAKSCRLRVIGNAVQPDNLADAMRRENCLAGVNGGYFDENFAPIGLLIADGKAISPIRHGRLLTGILAVSSRGVNILRLREFARREKFAAAVQCGPMIVDLGQGVRGLDDSRIARRTFAAVDRGDRAALGFCSEVTLADLAKILAAPLGRDFKFQRALNLDGGSSSAFWFKREDGSAFSIPEQKTVRDFVAVCRK